MYILFWFTKILYMIIQSLSNDCFEEIVVETHISVFTGYNFLAGVPTHRVRYVGKRITN